MWTATRERVFGWPLVPLHAKHETRARENITEHSHHDFAEVVVVAGGRGVQTSAVGAIVLERGAVVMLRPGGWHRTDEVRDLEYYNLYLSPELFIDELSWVLDSRLLTSNLVRGEETPTRLADDALERVTGWLGQIAGTARQLHRRALLGLAGCVLAEFADPDSPPPSSAAIARVRTVMSIMSSDVSHAWSVPDLADRVSVSASHLHRQFATHVGVTVIAWLDQLRGERAASLLASTGQTVAEIGRQVGWADPSYASRRFRSLYGMTPLDYRSRFSAAPEPSPAPGRNP